MKKYYTLTFFITMLTVCFTANGTEHHSQHAGGAGMGGGQPASMCTKAHVSKFSPAHLAVVSPESEFSFTAFNVFKPELISVFVKNEPVDIDIEFKDPFYIVKGKLPPQFVNMPVRINVKIASKLPRCETETGWLITVSDK